MTTVQTLQARVVDALQQRGINGSKYNGTIKGDTRWWSEKNEIQRDIMVDETFRQNHADLENVTVRAEVIEWDGCSGTVIARVKVPKDASDRVIENRVEQVLRAYRNQ